MGTPFIAFMGPTNLDGYNRSLPATGQPSTIPKTFLDAMEVREEVFRIRKLLGPRLIISPSHEAILPNVPPENVEAIYEAVMEYGQL